ncbi:MAG: hypothetical protein ACYC6F_02805 [Longimicrobiales bacterium]
MSAFEVVFDGGPTTGRVTLRPGQNLITGIKSFEEAFGLSTSLEEDLLTLASAVFAADRGTARGERELVSRRIELTVPVVNAGRLAPLEGALELVLRELSNDSWRITLPQRSGEPEAPSNWPSANGKILLFSGGLDSLAAAVRLGDAEGLPHLVSHCTMNSRTREAQRALVAGLSRKGRAYPHDQLFVSARSDLKIGFDHQAEGSQRTRSFVFLVLGALVGRRVGRPDVVVLAENGQLAIHLPLSSARVGAFSTHTAFPDVLVGMEQFLGRVLGIPLRITNPFVHETKAEVIARVLAFCPELVPLTESCWRNARLGDGVTHCGECIPCFVRRIAIEANGQKDPTAYGCDPWTADVPLPAADDTGRRNIIDLAEFVVQFERLSDAEIMDEWPELYSHHIDASAVIAMYRRFAREARTVLDAYARVREVLG